MATHLHSSIVQLQQLTQERLFIEVVAPYKHQRRVVGQALAGRAIADFAQHTICCIHLYAVSGAQDTMNSSHRLLPCMPHASLLNLIVPSTWLEDVQYADLKSSVFGSHACQLDTHSLLKDLCYLHLLGSRGKIA